MLSFKSKESYLHICIFKKPQTFSFNLTSIVAKLDLLLLYFDLESSFLRQGPDHCCKVVDEQSF